MPFHRRDLMVLAAFGGALGIAGLKAQEVERHAVADDGLVGEFHTLQGARAETAVLLLTGSDGGLPSARDARDLAAAGFPTLSLACFKDWNGRPTGVPDRLSDIPLEYVFRAIDWLKRRSEVDPRRIVLVGLSRGAELALLVASLRPDIAGVAAFSPSSRVWRGVPSPGEPATASRPAWTLAGQAVPYQIDRPDPTQPIRAGFEAADVNPAARIPVERITGPVLLVSSLTDGIWPSDIFADEIADSLARRAPGSSVENLQFDDASHLLMGLGPGLTRLEIPGTTYVVNFGGTTEGTAHARAMGWRALKRFLVSL